MDIDPMRISQANIFTVKFLQTVINAIDAWQWTLFSMSANQARSKHFSHRCVEDTALTQMALLITSTLSSRFQAMLVTEQTQAVINGLMVGHHHRGWCAYL